MLTVKAPNVHITFRSEWNEVTLSEFIALYQSATFEDADIMDYTFRQALETFVSDIDGLHQLGAYEEARIIERLPFLRTVPDFDLLPVPTEVAGVIPPNDLGMCTLMQKWTVDEEIKEMRENGTEPNYINLAPILLGVYLYPMLAKKALTQTGSIDEVSDRVGSIPCTQALPLAAFFLSSYSNSMIPGQASLKISYPEAPTRKWPKTWFLNWKNMRIMRRWKSWRTADA